MYYYIVSFKCIKIRVVNFSYYLISLARILRMRNKAQNCFVCVTGRMKGDGKPHVWPPQVGALIPSIVKVHWRVPLYHHWVSEQSSRTDITAPHTGDIIDPHESPEHPSEQDNILVCGWSEQMFIILNLGGWLINHVGVYSCWWRGFKCQYDYKLHGVPRNSRFRLWNIPL